MSSTIGLTHFPYINGEKKRRQQAEGIEESKE
jgi:hypothetical protein